MTARQLIARVFVAALAVPFVLAVLPLDPVLYVARFLALATVAHLIWRYHKLADWSAVEIGRSTMAIKGAIFALAVAANIRTLDDLDTATWDTAFDVALVEGWVHALAEVGIVVGWLSMAAALIHRDRLVVRMQGDAHALPAPPPPHHLPSEEIKEHRR